jgi:hypothetical protein
MDGGQIEVLEEEHPERTAVFLYSKEKERKTNWPLDCAFG